MKLTTQEYKDMTAKFRKECGMADAFISAVQRTFGTVDNVISYHCKLLVIFADGQRWIANGSLCTFYRVDIRCEEWLRVPKK